MSVALLHSLSTVAPASVPHPRGCRVEDIPEDVCSSDGWRPLDWINHDRADGTDRAPPPGWYSIPHWWALTEWHCFEMWEGETAEVLAECLINRGQGEDSFYARAIDAMNREGLAPIEWPAPPRIKAAGYSTVLLYPDAILRDVFPAHGFWLGGDKS